ncbi:hypothetical protein Hanom_Chr13g01203971 [Helianthus anomalus]
MTIETTFEAPDSLQFLHSWWLTTLSYCYYLYNNFITVKALSLMVAISPLESELCFFLHCFLGFGPNQTEPCQVYPYTLVFVI